MKRFVGLGLLLFLAGCAQSVGNPMADAANNLIATKKNAIVAFEAVSASCQQSLLPKETCMKMPLFYDNFQLAYKTASDSLILAVATGDAPKSDVVIPLNTLLQDILQIKLSVKGGTK